MARRPLSPPDRKPGFAVEHYSVDARRLITIDPASSLWICEDAKAWVEEHIEPDSIVRVQPPASIAASTLQLLEAYVRQRALAVKVLPPLPSERALVDQAAPSPEESQSIREVVYEMVTVARTGNRDLLVDVVEEALAAAGL